MKILLKVNLWKILNFIVFFSEFLSLDSKKKVMNFFFVIIKKKLFASGSNDFIMFISWVIGFFLKIL